MLHEPRQALADVRLGTRRAGLLQDERDQPGRKTVARDVQRRAVLALPRRERRRRPSAVLLLPAERGVDDRLTRSGFEEPGQLARRPQRHQAIEQRFRFRPAPQVVAQRLHPILNIRARGVVARCCADRDRRERGAEVRRPVRFPRLVVEIQPGPRALHLAGRELKRPEIAERLQRVVAECGIPRIMSSENQRVHHCFGAARLAGFR